MVGRGTRLDVTTNKLMFTLYDYTEARKLFGEAFLTKLQPKSEGGGETPPRPPEPIITVEGFDIEITDAGRFILTTVDGKAMPVSVEEYQEQLISRLVSAAPTPDRFRRRWVAPDDRRDLINTMVSGGVSPMVVQLVRDMQDYDLYDVLAELGYGLNPRTRMTRVIEFSMKQQQWLNDMPAKTAATINAIAQQFIASGIEGLENPTIFQVPEVVRAGGLPALKLLGKPMEIIQETKVRLFAA
jgi:type I restriction enzyme R subunit